ncbi:MAG: GNAT family N-acetyltransferase [Coriobacteriia bacterium]
MESAGLSGKRLSLRSLEESDLPAISELAAQDGAQPWWSDASLAGVRAALVEAPATSSWTVIIDGDIAGAVSAFDVGWPLGTTMGLAIVFGDAWQDQGYGPEALSVVIAHLISRGIRRFTVDPAGANSRAIRAYESLGFRTIGVARQSEPAPDGVWRDCLLMDLLSHEFIDRRHG